MQRNLCWVVLLAENLLSLVNTLLIDFSPGEVRVAALSDQKIIEFYHHNYSNIATVGAIFCARVTHLVSRSRLIFLDIGLEYPAILSQPKKALDIGQRIFVRIVQPARLDKGAKVVIVPDQELQRHLGAAEAVKGTIGCIVKAEHPINMCIRLYEDTLENIICSPLSSQKRLESILGYEPKIPVKYTNSEIFREHGIDDVIEESLEPVVTLAGGARLILENTSAFTAVDIDSGPLSPVIANEIAVSALADEIRRRAIGGGIIVDLIPCRDRGKYVTQLRELVTKDPVPTRVSGLTPEGRLELNRRRVRRSLQEELLNEGPQYDRCPRSVGFEILRRCVRLGLVEQSLNIQVSAHPIVVNLLKNILKAAVLEAESILKVSIRLQESKNSKVDSYDILL